MVMVLLCSLIYKMLSWLASGNMIDPAVKGTQQHTATAWKALLCDKHNIVPVDRPI